MFPSFDESLMICITFINGILSCENEELIAETMLSAVACSAVAISQKRLKKGSNPNPRYNKAQPIPSCLEYCLGSGKDGCGQIKGV